MKRLPSGADLIKAIGEGRLHKAPSKYVEETRFRISTALEELIETGARIRPLLVSGKRVGWVRSVLPRERRLLSRWVLDQNEHIEQIFKAATTLSLEEIRDLSMPEMRSLSRLIREMTERDISLYPYISAFVTTGTSEQLWYSRGSSLASFDNKVVHLPDGRSMGVMTSSDHARLWATLCQIRQESKQRIEAASNAVLIIRPWVGKGADPLSNDLKNAAQMLKTDILEPWTETITYSVRKESFEDGWAHSEDESIEGIQRELKGMLENDKHEQVITAFHRQMTDRETKKQEKLKKALASKAKLMQLQDTNPLQVMTEAEFKAREAAIKAQKPKLTPVLPEDGDDLAQQSAIERLTKYK